MKNKIILVFLLLLLAGKALYSSEKLGMFIEAKRYLDDNKNTRFVIDYQVPYKNLMFMSRGSGFVAELKVTLAIANADSVLLTKEFTNNIGVTRKYDVIQSNKSYLDRISLTLAKSGFELRLRFDDLYSEKFFEWTYVTEQLDYSEKLSDLELLSSISPDTLNFSQKFQRAGRIHIPEPSGLIAREGQDSIYVFLEVYDLVSDDAKAVLNVKKDDISYFITSRQIDNPEMLNYLLFPINAGNLDTGKYTATVSVTDGQEKVERTLEFFVTENVEQLYFLLEDPDEEYLLIRYIAPVKSTSNWRSMSKDAKRRYISSFWNDFALSRNMSVDALLKTYRARVDHSNSRFSHFEKGWKSDMGRIYIRNGPPSDIEKETTTDDTRFIRRDYQIWKYRGFNKAVYLFIDIQMNGNYKLVYVDNDENESTNLNWRRYLGKDFDDSLLDN